MEIACLRCEEARPLMGSKTFYIPRKDGDKVVQENYPVSVCRQCLSAGWTPVEMRNGLVVWSKTTITVRKGGKI